ncbi:glycoside hydrolase family 3 protein [Paraglaciecola marina]|uniref:glycoside hydrolase family 3 protein n=1 Tax=Paraglaciecola marina TaxID=2500157 RepID=UPI00105F7D00|nr:glycoside hydrolase family 3 protein [Paraglaciecola marina]
MKLSNQPLLANKVVQQKVDNLLSKMTLEQKIGQMTQAERMSCTPEQAKQYHIGSILSSAGSRPDNNHPEGWVAMNEAYWQASSQADENHLGIPTLYGLDAVHGNNNVTGATVFPHNIGLGAANDIKLLQKIAITTAKEVLATGVDWSFAPNLAIAHDTHWGRTYESYASKPKPVGKFAAEIVKGLQGDLSEDHIMACAKHWVGDGGATYGIDHGDTILSWEELHKTHIPPFVKAIDTGVLSIMVSFSSWNGDKCHGHKFLLTDILKEKLGFEGIVISDMQGIDYLADDFYLAVAMGVNAGIDMFMVPRNWSMFIDNLLSHVQLGTVPIARINEAVRRILTVKTAFGLFDKPSPANRKWSNHASFGSFEHREVAREAVQKSLVLLKHEKNILPLDKQAKFLVAGKNANNLGHQCGGFTINWQGVSGNESIQGGTSIWNGITSLAEHASLSQNQGKDADPKQHEFAIVVIGETPYSEGLGDIRKDDKKVIESGTNINGQVKVLEAYGHSLELSEFHPEDILTIKNITDRGVPVITVLVSGRPLIVEKEMALSSAFVAAWLPGSEGQGVADVLFGDKNFKGKLAFDWPKTGNEPSLFKCGYGLKYK